MKTTNFTSISRPTREHWLRGNLEMFFAAPATGVCFWLWPNQYSEPITWVIFCILGFIATRCGWGAFIAFRNDYRLRTKYEISQTASNTAYDSRFATTAEIEAAGCYDGKGRILGNCLDGRPIFLPHRLKPTNSKITAAAGAGKTTAFCVPSCILSLFSART